MQFDPYMMHYASRRNMMVAKNGMVATSNPLASQAGLEVLKKGGNAVDAIIAAASTLTVVEPTANGIGGDGFAIVYFDGQIYGLNASGPAPELINAKKLIDQGLSEVPRFGLIPVTVPGVVAGWAALSKRFGQLSLEETLSPAVAIAHDGFSVVQNVASGWKRSYKNYKLQLEKEPVLQTWFDAFCPNGVVPDVGDVFYASDHAKTLMEIGKTSGESFYRGALADQIADFVESQGGYLRKSDLQRYEVEWVDPISTNYRGYDVLELPPNGHGILVLMALNIYEQFNHQYESETSRMHQMIESMKLAFSDGLKHIADTAYMKVSLENMLSKEYAKKRSQLITKEALMPEAGELEKNGTVYLCAADKDGNMVSYIQSNYTGFGSGVVVPNTGISLHNRGAQFNLDVNHVNVIEPFKRPYHTIIPGFLMKDGRALGPFGIMGGPMQPQAHLQVLSSLIDDHLNPQDALDKPRWQWIKDKTILVEPSMPAYLIEAMIRKGHQVEVANEPLMFGRGQIIIRKPNGTYVGATEPRTDGYVAVY